MLSELRIKNLAVVEDAVIPFSGGLNVLTGSTGAGKSIILSAVDLLSGSRAKRTMIRRGAETLTVEGTFHVPALAPIRGILGMEPEDDMIAIRRELHIDGKSRIWINGMLSSNTVAREITGSLFELHGQRRQQELLDPASHIEYLDAGGDYQELIVECAGLVASYRRLRERVTSLREDERRHKEQEEYYRFQLAEIEKLSLKPGIDEEIAARIRLTENRHRFTATLEECHALLASEDEGILARLHRLEQAFRFLESLDTAWEGARRETGDFRIAAQEILRQVERYLGGDAEEADDVEMLQSRLAAIQRTARKHGLDCSGLIARRDELRRILHSLTEGSDEIIEAERRLEETRRRLVPLCERLSELRSRTASGLDREVTTELRRLGMNGALFRTSIEQPANSTSLFEEDALHLTQRGWDRVEFMIRTNIGEDMHPLSDVASGGELSRITLVLKALQAGGKSISTLIFDEIDSGLGADLGEVVAQRMHELSGRYQIVCITHLPQIAARAERHILVDKRVKGGRTVTAAASVDGEHRINEIARMLGGPGALREKLAAELLRTGKGARSSAG